MSKAFVHLRVRSRATPGECALPPEAIPPAARAAGMTAVALADPGTVVSVPAFIRAARVAGVKAIVGAEVRVRFEVKSIAPILLLCRSRVGWGSLVAILGARGRDGAVAFRRMARHARGITVLAGADAVEAGALPLLARAFGREHVFVELCCDNLPRWQDRAGRQLDAARAAGLVPVATFDGSGGLERPEEAAQAFDWVPEAVENTVSVAAQVKATPDFSLPRVFPAPTGSDAGALRKRALDALHGRAPSGRADAYEVRLEAELASVDRLGLSGVFLVLADLVADARRAGIPVGPGRGSIADTLLAWLLGVTAPDPVALDLTFERHLAGRGSGAGSVAIDVGAGGLAACRDLLARRHGADRVARPVAADGGPCASRVVVADRPLAEVVPLRRPGRAGVIDLRGQDVAELGLWCVDLLPRPDLDRLADAEARARAADPAFDEDATPLDDPAVLRAVCEGPALDSTALGDRGFRDLLRRLQPGRFTDLVAAWSLWRDPVDAGMADALVERRHGRVPADPPVPYLGPHLGETYGLLLYQEQVIRVVREVAGLAAEEAAGMRRGLATRNPTEVARCRAAFVSGAAGRGVPEPEACAAFDLLEARTAAAFCKGHAACETLLAWRFARAGTQRAATRTKPFPRA